MVIFRRKNELLCVYSVRPKIIPSTFDPELIFRFPRNPSGSLQNFIVTDLLLQQFGVSMNGTVCPL